MNRRHRHKPNVNSNKDFTSETLSHPLHSIWVKAGIFDLLLMEDFPVECRADVDEGVEES